MKLFYQIITPLSYAKYIIASNIIRYLPLPLNEPCRWQPPASLNKGRLLTKNGADFFAERLYIKKSSP